MAQTFTPQEIGQKLKQANPGKFDSYDDVQLANFYIEAKPQAKSAVLEQSAPVGVAKGVGKSALSAVKEASGLGERVLGSIAQTLLPKSVERAIGIDKKPTLGDMFKQQPQATSAQKLQTDVEQRLDIVPGSLTEARTGAQQVGKFTGDVAQFLAPTGLATRAGKAASLASKASGGTKLAQFGARIAPQVASDVAVGTLQTGSPVEGLKAGAFSTAFPVAGAGLSKVASKIPKIQSVRLAERVVDSMVKPLKKFETYGKNPARGVVSEGITFNTLEEGAQKIGERADSLVAELRNVLTSPVNANKSIDLTGIGKIFDDQIDVLVKQNNVAGVNKLREAKRALTEDLGLIDGEIVSQGTKSLVLNPEKSIELKRMIGEMRTWTGQASEEKIVNKTLLDAYRLINNQVNKAVPSAEKLNSRISDLLSAQEAIIYRDQIASRANLLPLGARITGVVSLLAGVTTLNPLLIGVALADFGIDAALSSPAFKSRFAQWLAKANVTERQALSETVPALKPILDRIFVGEKKLTAPAIQRQLDDTYKEMLALPARGGTVPQAVEQKAIITAPPTTFEKGVKPNFIDTSKAIDGEIVPKTKATMPENSLINEAKKLDTLNPTGSIFAEYTPQQRATAELGENITTLDKTMGKSSDEMVTIYRGTGTGKEIVPGDFITTNKQLAQDYAGTGKIVEKKVKLSDILDDKTEPLGEEYIYRPKINSQESSLISEAKKYKNAEEFVKAKVNNLHGSEAKFDAFDFSKSGSNLPAYRTKNKIVTVTSDKSLASHYGKNTVEAFVDPLRVKEYGSLPLGGSKLDDIIEQAKKEGYGAISSKQSLSGASDLENGVPVTFVFDKSAIKTKSQLEQIWKEANKKK